ncbi:hypothetical protein LDL49_56240, partial [Nonomuraea sp. NEAU-L178]|nr:hypothetical protein [Nonomuraea aurantiaca]
MSDPSTTTTNIADGSATVGVQAEAVHGDVFVYQIPPDASPEQRFEVGVRYLSGGMPAKAREHIGEAVLNGYVTSRSCFYLLLALLSGRTLQQLPKNELSLLVLAQGRVIDKPDDEWIRAIKVVNSLLASLQARDVDPPAIEEQLKQLSDEQRNDILKNLEMLLSGPVQDGLWARVLSNARDLWIDREGVYLPGDRLRSHTHGRRANVGWEGTPMLTVVPDPADGDRRMTDGLVSAALID